jgi:hypothetical protein
MSRNDVSHNKAGVTATASIMWQLRTTATQRVWIYEIGVSIATAPTTGPSWSINRPLTLGTSTATIVGQQEDPGVVAPVTLLETTWSAAPTRAATPNPLRRYATPNSIGSGIVWTWYDQPLVVPVSSGLQIWNDNAAGTTAGAFNIYIVFGE